MIHISILKGLNKIEILMFICLCFLCFLKKIVTASEMNPSLFGLPNLIYVPPSMPAARTMRTLSKPELEQPSGVRTIRAVFTKVVGTLL